MRRSLPTQILGALILVQAVLKVGYPLSALRSFIEPNIAVIGIGVLTLGMWAALVASGIGLLLKKRWTLWCMIAFTVLTPVALLPFVPFVTRILAPILTPGQLSFLIEMLIINLLVVLLAFYLMRREGNARAA